MDAEKGGGKGGVLSLESSQLQAGEITRTMAILPFSLAGVERPKESSAANRRLERGTHGSARRGGTGLKKGRTLL
jgi:hypothetical protein